MGRQRQLRRALAQGLARLQREQRARVVAVRVLHGVILVQHAPGPDQVAGERDLSSVDLADEHAASVRMAFRRNDLQLEASPRERLVVDQRLVDRHVLADREEGVSVVVVAVEPLVSPEKLYVLEQVPLVLGDRDFGSGFAQLARSPTLVPVVVRVQHPVDPAHADLVDVLDNRAGARVDQQAAVAVLDAIHVARV